MSILYRIGEPEHPFNEVVGILQRIKDESTGRVLLIVRRNGKRVEVPEQDIITMKIVPT